MIVGVENFIIFFLESRFSFITFLLLLYSEETSRLGIDK